MVARHQIAECVLKTALEELAKLVALLLRREHIKGGLVEQRRHEAYVLHGQEPLAERLPLAHELEVIDDEEALVEDEAEQRDDVLVFLDLFLQ